MINITIDGRKICTSNKTVLAAAQETGVFIPSLCHDERFLAHGSCGLCVVEIKGLPRLARACAIPVTEGMEISTDSKRVVTARKHLLELMFSDHTGECKASCQLACPASTDCQGYITLIAQGHLREAYQRMMEAHPFPASVARICPRVCETKCRRARHDEPINIAGLKRFVTDLYGGTVTRKIAPETGFSVAIVGGGPAGLTAAYFLRLIGHKIVVYDHMPKMGGLLRYGIPEYRLPKSVLDIELSVLEKIGIEFHNNKRFGDNLTIAHLQKQYNAVIIAIGAGKSHPLNIEGEELPNVVGGIDFLKQVAHEATVSDTPINNGVPTSLNTLTSRDAPTSQDPPTSRDVLINNIQCTDLVGKKIVVIGGSNTAIDSARTALRLGAEVVTIAYRRTKNEMPADPSEIAEAEEEGVLLKFLLSPKEIKPGGILLQKMILPHHEGCDGNTTNLQHKPDATVHEPTKPTRLNPVPLPGHEQWLQADLIITAIGQAVAQAGLDALDKSWSNIKADPQSFETNLPGVFAIGDATGQSAYAIEAIGHARKAAAGVDAYIANKASSSHESVSYKKSEYLNSFLMANQTLCANENHLLGIPKASRETEAKKETHKGLDKASKTLRGFEEIYQSLTANQASREASRCLSCGCGKYQECKLINIANIYAADPAKYCKKPDTTIPEKCSSVEADDFLHPADTNNPLFIYDPNKCVLCGLCVKACAQDRAILTMANRGPKTMVIAHPQENCAHCGNCLAICPTGARTDINSAPAY